MTCSVSTGLPTSCVMAMEQYECTITITLPEGARLAGLTWARMIRTLSKKTGEDPSRSWGTGRAQAFKRAAVAFGVGRYVYALQPGQRPAERPTAPHSAP